MMNTIDNLITEEQAAQRFGRSRNWLRNMRLKGKGPTYVPIGNTIMYDPLDVDAWMDTLKTEPKTRQRKAAKAKARPKAAKARASKAAPAVETPVK